MVYFSSKPMLLLFLQLPEKRVLDPNGQYISTSQTKIRTVCLSLILDFCLLSVVFSASTAYTNLCRRLKYLLKEPYIIQDYPITCSDFWFSRLDVWADRKHFPMSKKYHKNEWHLRLVRHSLTKLSQNMYLINIHIRIQ